MTEPSNSTQPTSANWGPKQWIQYIHAASTVPSTDPNYELARQRAADAVAQLDVVNRSLAENDPERLRPGAIPTFLVALGNGASLGIMGNAEDAKLYLQAGREAGHGTAATLGNLAGFGATAALTGAALSAAAPGLSATAAGAIGGGATGAIQGAASADPGTRGMGALMGGGLGLLLGGGTGYVAGKALPILQRVPWAGRFFGASEIDAAEGQLRKELQAQGFNRADISKATSAWRSAQANEAILRSSANQAYQKTLKTLTARGVPEVQAASRADEAAVNAVRRHMQELNVPPEQIEARIQTFRQTGTLPRPSAVAPIDVPSRIRAVQASIGRELTPDEKITLIQRTPSDAVAVIPGTEGRGFSVTGERVTPPVPTKQTLAEMTGMANLQPSRTAPDVMPKFGRNEPGYGPRQVWNRMVEMGYDPNDPVQREAMKAAARRASPSWKKDWDPKDALGIAATLGLAGAASSARTQ